MHTIVQYQDFFLDYLKNQNFKKNPDNLYNPIKYILSLGGKRMRPILTLMATEAFNVNYSKALPAAMALEVFHNFSLVHDDIMDAAPLRRGKQTIHEKWGVNTGILSGDAMLILAYQYFEQYETNIFRDLAKLFSKTALQVCEGQQLDIDFETRQDVSISEYLKMIQYKTGVLIGAALQMGAIISETSKENSNLIYDFGVQLGTAFQLQDDYLDAFGDPKTFGKQVGGDIIENKKTFLYLKALEFLNIKDTEKLKQLFSTQLKDNTQKITIAKELFLSSGAAKITQDAIKEYTFKAFDTLEKMTITNETKIALKTFGENLMNRKM